MFLGIIHAPVEGHDDRQLVGLQLPLCQLNKQIDVALKPVQSRIVSETHVQDQTALRLPGLLQQLELHPLACTEACHACLPTYFHVGV
jgi:hypothetical protein